VALLFDPERQPVLGADGHLPAIGADVVAPEALRTRFRAPPDWAPEIAVERRFGGGREPAAASVLIAVVLRPEGATVLFTERTAHLNDHPGQISFPGGRAEPEDADAVATALREAEEETGLDPGRVEVVGTLPTYTTGTGFVVTPVVGFVQPGFALAPDPFEVAEVFEVPLAFLMDPAHHLRHAVEIGGERREYLSMPWQGTDAQGAPKRWFIWGATAAMLRNLYRFLAA
jgi:8-oxo-dGTP pyrophosphatase MutT (NUDIX family)